MRALVKIVWKLKFGHALDLCLCIVDPGHIATERPGINALLQLVRETVDLEVVDLTEFDPVTWS